MEESRRIQQESHVHPRPTDALLVLSQKRAQRAENINAGFERKVLEHSTSQLAAY